MDTLQKQANKDTLERTGKPTYDGHLSRLEKWLVANNRIFDRQAIADFLSELAKNLTPSTVANYKQAIKKSLSKTAVTFAQRAELDSSFSDMKIAKADKKVYREMVISKADGQAVVAGLSPKMRLVYETLAVSGLRVSELCNIRTKDINKNKESVSIRIIGKGKKERRIMIGHGLLARIQKSYGDGKYLFTTKAKKAYDRKYLHRVISEAGRYAGLVISPHSLRHTFATTQIKAKGGSVKAVSEYLGHANTSTTESMYVHDQLSFTDIKKMSSMVA